MKKILILMVFFAAGCAADLRESKYSPMPQQIEKPRPDYSSGSIWQSASGGLVEDFKARARGDTVTVVITENASTVATTGTNRNTEVAAGSPNLLGLETTAIKNYMDLSKLLNANTSSKFEGSGSTTRKENLNATITAQVVDVLANGNLLIEGRRSVMVNNEDQIILLEGIVRPQDISANNIVYSAQIADARITYSGKGIISERQRPGWLMNILDYVWPF
jgi:flagellar L-ring protein precursor FlgH